VVDEADKGEFQDVEEEGEDANPEVAGDAGDGFKEGSVEVTAHLGVSASVDDVGGKPKPNHEGGEACEEEVEEQEKAEDRPVSAFAAFGVKELVGVGEDLPGFGEFSLEEHGWSPFIFAYFVKLCKIHKL